MSLDDAFLRRLVARCVGVGARVSAYGRHRKTPMAEVLALAEEYLGRPLAVYWIDGGVPEIFSLPGLDPPVIAFSTRHLEMLGAVRGTLTSGHFRGELMERVSKCLSLRIIAELTLRQGDASAACHLFLESALNGGLYTVPVTMAEFEALPFGELYMAMWFYGLLHECGHIALAHGVETTDTTSQENVSEFTRTVISRMYGNDPEFVHEAMSGGSEARSLDPQILTEEAQADLIGMRLLMIAHQRVLGSHDALTEDSAFLVAAHSLRLFQLFHYMNSCARVAQAAALQPGSLRTGVGWDPAHTVANTVRLNILIDELASSAAGGAGSDARNEHRFRVIKAELFDVLRDAANPDFDRGHQAALDLALLVDDRPLDVFDRLAAHVAEATALSSTFQREASAFISLARSLNIDHPDLDLLVDIAASPTEVERLATAHLKTFSLIWVTGPETHQPFVIPLDDGKDPAAPVYRTDAIDQLLKHVRTRIPPSHSAEKITFESATDHLARIAIHNASGLDARQLTVAFEGSAAFDSLIARLPW